MLDGLVNYDKGGEHCLLLSAVVNPPLLPVRFSYAFVYSPVFLVQRHAYSRRPHESARASQTIQAHFLAHPMTSQEEHLAGFYATLFETAYNSTAHGRFDARKINALTNEEVAYGLKREPWYKVVIDFLARCIVNIYILIS